MARPSALMSTYDVAPSSLSMTASGLEVATSQTRTVPSTPELTNCLPSRLKRTPVADPSCPRKPVMRVP